MCYTSSMAWTSKYGAPADVEPARSLSELYDMMTPRERHFLQAYIENGMNITQAYLTISPTASHKTAKVNGYRVLERVRRKAGGREGLLEMYGLGEERLMREVDARLKATKVEVYQGALVRDPTTGQPMEFEDNGTRMAGTKLLAELHGARKQSFTGPDGSGPVEVALIKRVVVRPGDGQAQGGA